MTNPGVFEDGEFRRIRDLPRRPQQWTPEQSAEAVELLTQHLRTPSGSMRLKPIQARALVEAHDAGGLVGEIVAGGGKALLSFLLPVVMEAQRTLLLVPAHLRVQTHDVHKDLSQHWKIPPLFGTDFTEGLPGGGAVIRVLSYQSLSTVNFATFLENYQPDLIIADEAHFLARLKTSRGRKLWRYYRDRKKAGSPIKFVPLTGTMRRRKIPECAHLYSAALPGRSPWPEHWPVLQQWSAALDEGISPDARVAPGALLTFCTAEEANAGLDGVRRAMRRRLVEAPGVVVSTEPGVDVPLTIEAVEVKVPKEIQEAIAALRRTGALPGGLTSEGGLEDWNHARELACGFCYRTDPPAPEPWREAKKNWGAFVREILDRPKLKLDSPLQVWNAVEAGQFGRVEAWETWKAIRHTFKPNTVPTWLSDWLVKDAEDWALRTGGIVWLSHSSAFTFNGDADSSDDALGEAFKRIPYFGGGAKGEGIKTYRGPCVASIRARGTGANLQQWSEARIMCLPSSGATLEQLLARHHRDGQTADEVRFSFYIHSYELFDAFRRARADARYAESMNGSPQRLNYCTILGPDGHAFTDDYYKDRLKSSDPMWNPQCFKEKNR